MTRRAAEICPSAIFVAAILRERLGDKAAFDEVFSKLEDTL